MPHDTHQKVLYIGLGCPYCSKVLVFMRSHGIDIPIVDVWRDKDQMQKLIKLTGRRQVPCLSIDGVGMLESDDIIEYLKSLD